MSQRAWEADPAYTKLKSWILGKTGLIYFGDKDADLYLRLERRFAALQISGCQAYYDLLTANGQSTPEFEHLVIELTIGETYFFRHQEQFDALKAHVIPKLIEQRRAERKLRVWSAGCSIGAEPYSLAILLNESFGGELVGWDVKIIATDLNRAFLTKAETGVFEDWAFRTTGPELRARHFEAIGKSWRLRPEHRRLVDFYQHNLLHSPMPVLKEAWGGLDLIVCRNVMIYFDWPTVAKDVMPHFEGALGQNGWLVIGHAEQAHGAQALKFEQVDGVTLYHKVGVPTPLTVNPFLFAPPAFSAPILPPAPVVADPAVDLARLKTLADGANYAQALVLANDLVARHVLEPRLFFYRALVFEQLGQRAEVESNLLQAIYLDRKFVMAHYYLALHYRHAQLPKKADRSFRNVRDLIDALPEHASIPEADELRVADLRAMVATYLGAA